MRLTDTVFRYLQYRGTSVQKVVVGWPLLLVDTLGLKPLVRKDWLSAICYVPNTYHTSIMYIRTVYMSLFLCRTTVNCVRMTLDICVSLVSGLLVHCSIGPSYLGGVLCYFAQFAQFEGPNSNVTRHSEKI